MHLNKKSRVIITYGRSLMALMMAQSLHRRGVRVIGCDSIDMTVLSFSKAVHSMERYHEPSDDEDAFIDDLVKIAKKHSVDDGGDYILMPAFKDAKIIAQYKDRFEGLITVSVPDFNIIDSVDPKDHFFETAQDLNAAVPKTWVLSSKDEAKKFSKKAQYPLFIKPPNEVGGHGISKVDKAEDFMDAYEKANAYEGTPMAQEAAPGDDYCYCALYDHGELKASMVYKNVKKFPQISGAGVMRETIDASLFDPLARQLMKPLKWHGVVEIDFMWDGLKDSQPLMIEVNPRFWAGLDHSVRSGVDFPWLLYQLYTGRDVDQSTAEVGYQSRLPIFPALADLQTFFDKSIHLEALSEGWPDVVGAFKAGQWSEGVAAFKDALAETTDFKQGYKALKAALKSTQNAEPLDMHKDDPFIGLGVFFVLGYLLRYGALPPELE